MDDILCKNKCCMHKQIDSESIKDVDVNSVDFKTALKPKTFEDVTQEFLAIISAKNDGVIKEIKKIQDEVIKIENMKRDFENLMGSFANKYHEETQLLYKKLNEAAELVDVDDESIDDFEKGSIFMKKEKRIFG